MSTHGIEARHELLRLARLSLEAAVLGSPSPRATGAAVFDVRAGAFVTLEHDHRLRGCIGQLEPGRLGDLLVYCARAAALEDPRFPRVVPDELAAIHIEVSVLTPLVRLDDPSAVRPGIDGLLVSYDGRHGVLLPQVATDHGWPAEEFLRQTCVKAGVAGDAWRRGAQLFTFEADVFGESARAAG